MFDLALLPALVAKGDFSPPTFEGKPESGSCGYVTEFAGASVGLEKGESGDFGGDDKSGEVLTLIAPCPPSPPSAMIHHAQTDMPTRYGE